MSSRVADAGAQLSVTSGGRRLTLKGKLSQSESGPAGTEPDSVVLIGRCADKERRIIIFPPPRQNTQTVSKSLVLVELSFPPIKSLITGPVCSHELLNLTNDVHEDFNCQLGCSMLPPAGAQAHYTMHTS